MPGERASTTAPGSTLPATSRQPFAGDAVQLISETAERVDGLRVLTLGPLTNLADALEQPSGPRRSGSSPSTRWAARCSSPATSRFGGPPDNEVAEWNIYVDPTAAQMVIDSGLTVRLVSLDGTNQVPVTLDSRSASGRRRPVRARSCSRSSSPSIRS